MSNHNFAVLSGNIGADPELRVLPDSDQTVTDFRIAHTPRRYNQSTKEWEDGETMWVRVAVWGKKGELVAEHFRKGNRVVVAGKLSHQQWEYEGKNYAQIVLTADSVTMEMKPPKQGGQPPAQPNIDPWNSTPTTMQEEEPPF